MILTGLAVAPQIVRWIGYAVAALAVLALIWWAAVVPRMELRDERAHHAATKADCAEKRAQWAAELAEAHAKARARERELSDAVTTAQGELDARKAEIRRKDAALAAANARLGSLRQQRAEYLAAVRVSENPAAASNAAAVLAELAGQGDDLLGEGAELLRACAADVDTAVAERDALIRAWPR
jgi:chromosome segregation ATPase